LSETGVPTGIGSAQRTKTPAPSVSRSGAARPTTTPAYLTSVAVSTMAV